MNNELSRMSEIIAVVPTPAEAPFKCRICFADKANFYSLDDLLIVPTDQQVPVAMALSYVTNEPLEDINNPLLPSRLCENCITQLQESYIFNLTFSTSKLVWNEYLTDLQNPQKSANSQPIPSPQEDELKNEIGDSEVVESRVEFEYDLKDEHSCHDEVKPKPTKDSSKKATNSKSKPIRMHPCPMCTESFTALDLKAHVKTHPSLRSYLKARGIPKFDKKVKFYAVRDPDFKPLLSRTNPVLHKCIYCADRFTATDLGDHIDQHLKEGNVTCDICSRQFHDLKALRTHRVKHITQHPFECDECGKGFLIKENYECHLLKHENMLLHKCEFCYRQFSNPQHLKRHRMAVHELGKKPRRFPFKCKKCLCRYPSRLKLDQHQCKPLSNKEILRLKKPKQHHKRILCQYCGKYVWNSNAHMVRHTGGKMQKMQLCPICGKPVGNSLKYHMHRHTGEPSEKCEVCGKVFWKKEHLKQHFRVHTGEKPYKCRFCGLAFSRTSNKQVHERIHIGVKAHCCSICGKQFYEKSYLKKHMSTHRDKRMGNKKPGSTHPNTRQSIAQDSATEFLHFNVVD